MSVLDPQTEVGQYGGGTETAATDPTLTGYLEMSQEDQKTFHTDPAMREMLWQSLSANPDYIGMGYQDKANMVAEFGLPLDKIMIPNAATQMSTMVAPQLGPNFGYQGAPSEIVPYAHQPEPVQYTATGQPGQLPSDLPYTSPEHWVEMRRPTEMTWPTDPATGKPYYDAFTRAIFNTYQQKYAAIDPFVAPLRGMMAAVAPRAYLPPEYQPQMLSIDSAAQMAATTVAIGILAPIALGTAVGGVAAGLPTKIALNQAEKIPMIAAWMVKHPEVPRTIMRTMVESGRFAAFDTFRETVGNYVRTGELSPADALLMFGESVLANAVMGGAIGAGLSYAPQLMRRIGDPLKSYAENQRIRNADRQAARIRRTATDAAEGGRMIEQPAPPPTMDPMTGMPVEQPPMPRVEAPPVADAVRMDLENVLAPTQTVVHPDGSMTATVPVDLVKQVSPLPHDANRGDYLWLDGKNRFAMVLEKGENGLLVKEGGREYTLPFDSKKIKSIEGVRGPFEPGDAVHDAAGEYVVDRFVPNGRVYVVAENGKVLLKEPALLTTKMGQQTADLVNENAAKGIHGPVPEGRAIYQEFDVVDLYRGMRPVEQLEPKPVADAFTTGPQKVGFTRHVLNRLQAMDSDVPDPIVHRVVVEPTDVKLGTWQYFRDPWTVVEKVANDLQDPFLGTTSRAMATSARDANAEHAANNTLYNKWRRMTRVNEESGDRLKRYMVNVQDPKDTLTLPEQAVMRELTQWGQENLIPLANQRRQLLGQPPITDVFQAVMLLAPEHVLGAGNRFLVDGIDTHEIAPHLTATGQGRRVLVSPEMPQNIQVATGLRPGTVDLHIKGNFWEMTKKLMDMAADQKAYADTGELIRQAAHYARVNLKSESLGRYLDWADSSYGGRTPNAMVHEVFGHVRWMEKLEKIFGTETSAAVVRGTEDPVKLLSHRWNLSHADMYDIAGGMKTWSYAMGLGMSMRAALLNHTQLLTHIATQMPGRGVEAAIDNTIALAYGARRGFQAAAATTYSDLVSGLGRRTSAVAERIGIPHESMALFFDRAATLFDTKAIRYYKERGFIDTMDEVFTNTNAKEGIWQLTKDGFKALTFFNMRYSEIFNRVGGYHAIRESYISDIKRKGMTAMLQKPDVVAAIDELSELVTNTGNFLYGKGFKSMIHERGQVHEMGSSTKASIRGPLYELLSMYNIFTYKTLSLMGLEWKSMREGQPNALRRMMQAESPQEFGDYMETLKPEERFQIFRTMLFRAAAAVAVSNISVSMAMSVGPLSVFGFGLPPVITRPYDVVKDFNERSWGMVWKDFKKIFTPSGVKRQFIEGDWVRLKGEKPPKNIWEAVGASKAPWQYGGRK